MSSPDTLIAEIKDRSETWRSEHTDLPVTLLILSRLRSALHPGTAKFWSEKPEVKTNWARLRVMGEKISRRRALFTAAEAIGRRTYYQKEEKTASIRNELGIVLSEGTSGQKVRALRALRFIASDDCIPLLETALSDESRWVQTTALHTLFRLDLQKAEPRRVLENFLLAKFRQSLAWSWDSLAVATLRRNFNRNAGLFFGLLKERGGIGLAFLTLGLWITSSVLLFVVPLALLVVGLFCSVFVLFPVGVLSLPFLVRSINKAQGVYLKLKRIVFGLLDYVILALGIQAGLYHQYIYFGLSVGILWFLHLCSWPFNLGEDFEKPEAFRKFNRLSLTAVFALLSYRAGLPLTPKVFWALVVVQFFWVFPNVLPSIARALYPRKQKFIWVLVALKWCAIQLVKILISPYWLLKWLKRTSPKVAEEIVVLARSPRVQEFPQRFIVVTAQARNEARLLRIDLRKKVHEKVNKKSISKTVITVGVCTSALLFLYARLDSLRGSLLLNLRPYLYLAAGLLILLLPCWVVLGLLYLVWDEFLIVERVRLRLLSQRKAHPIDKPEQFLGFIFELIRNPNWPTSVRTRAALNLAQVPELSNEKDLAHLLDLAAEDLPLEVRDAIEQSAFVAEDRLRRGQIRTNEIDLALLNQEVQTLCVAGPILQPKIERGWQFAIGCSILVGLIQVFVFGFQRVIDVAAVVELVLGIGLVSSYLLFELQRLRRWTLLTGLILITIGLTHPLQTILAGATGPGFLNFGLEFVDSSTLRTLFFPTILACLIAQLGQTLHLLASDTTVNYEDGSDFLSRWDERRAKKPPLLKTALYIALAATLLQSEPLQEYLDVTKERMPTFVSKGVANEVQLENIPTDGRVVRVALVAVVKEPELKFDGEFPSIFDGVMSNIIQDEAFYIPSIERTFPPIYKPNRKPARNSSDDVHDTVFLDELWLRGENGEVTVWQPLPPQSVRCIGWSSSSSGSLTLNPRAHCTFDVKAKFVAIVYSKKRSAAVQALASSQNAVAEFAATSPKRNRVLANTLSPPARVIWSPGPL